MVDSRGVGRERESSPTRPDTFSCTTITTIPSSPSITYSRKELSSWVCVDIGYNQPCGTSTYVIGVLLMNHHHLKI